MGERPTVGFTAEDRKVLNQLPVILQNLDDKVEGMAQRLLRVEDQKANRSEVAELERQIISRLDNLTDWISKIEREKADRSELSVSDISDHEKRLRVVEAHNLGPPVPCGDHELRLRAIETKTVVLPDAMADLSKLKEWRFWTIGWCAGASLVVVVCAWLIQMLVKH